MEIINYNASKQILVSVKGHPYDRTAFFDIFEQQSEIGFTAVEQPATRYLLESPAAEKYDALVFYDMPGIDFSAAPPRFVDPPESLKERFLELTRRGQGMVFLHHAIAGWPSWETYGEIIGGRFLYAPAVLRGRPVLDSGYRHQVEYRARILGDHPVTAGLPADFAATDELYLYEVFEEAVIPLVAADYRFDADQFSSAHAAVGGGAVEDSWPHPPGSKLIGWVKHYNNSPIVYLQMGDAPAIYGNPYFRRLLFNAINWVTSPAAREWAARANAS